MEIESDGDDLHRVCVKPNTSMWRSGGEPKYKGEGRGRGRGGGDHQRRGVSHVLFDATLNEEKRGGLGGKLAR